MATMSPEREKTLRKLAEMMNTRHRNPFPISKALLDCFDIAISQQEAEFLIQMGTEPLTRERAAELSGMTGEAFKPFWDNLLKKGLVWPRISADGPDVFMLPGIMLGWFEIFLSDGRETPEQKEFARRLDRLFESWGKMNVFPLRNLFNKKVRASDPLQSIVAAQRAEAQQIRTIPVNQPVTAGPVRIYPARTVDELIERHGDDNNIAVVHCFCRQYHKMIGEPCRFEHPPQSCIVIGRFTRHALEYGNARRLSKAEAAALVRELEQKGAVHQVFHENERPGEPELAICNCCWDCCGVFGSYSRGIIPLNLKSYFVAQLSDPALCNACAICEDYCPVRAITMEDGRSSIDEKKCIGCGQCELHCPEHAVSLVPHERIVMLPLEKRSRARISG